MEILPISHRVSPYWQTIHGMGRKGGKRKEEKGRGEEKEEKEVILQERLARKGVWSPQCVGSFFLCAFRARKRGGKRRRKEKIMTPFGGSK
jgi:hypothetical protein